MLHKSNFIVGTNSGVFSDHTVAKVLWTLFWPQKRESSIVFYGYRLHGLTCRAARTFGHQVRPGSWRRLRIRVGRRCVKPTVIAGYNRPIPKKARPRPAPQVCPRCALLLSLRPRPKGPQRQLRPSLGSATSRARRQCRPGAIARGRRRTPTQRCRVSFHFLSRILLSPKPPNNQGKVWLLKRRMLNGF